MPRVLVIGSANVDFVVTVERLPAPGETVSEGTLLVNHGGKGANQAVAARRLGGAPVRLRGGGAGLHEARRPALAPRAGGGRGADQSRDLSRAMRASEAST